MSVPTGKSENSFFVQSSKTHAAAVYQMRRQTARIVSVSIIPVLHILK